MDVPSAQHLPRWRLYKADWLEFQKKVNQLMRSCNLDTELNELAKRLTKVIIEQDNPEVPKAEDR